MEMTKILISKEEYDILRIQAVQLQIIQNAMEENMALFSTKSTPYLKDGFLSVLKIIFPAVYDDKYMELLEEAEEKERGERVMTMLNDLRNIYKSPEEGDQ